MKNHIRKFILGWVVNALAIYLCAYFLDDFSFDYYDPYGGWLILPAVSLVFGILSWFLKPVIKILSLPLFFLGPFIYFVANSVLLVLISFLVGTNGEIGFTAGDITTVEGITSAAIAGGIVGIVNFIAHLIV